MRGRTFRFVPAALDRDKQNSEPAATHMVTGTLVLASQHKLPVPKCFVLNSYNNIKKRNILWKSPEILFSLNGKLR